MADEDAELAFIKELQAAKGDSEGAQKGGDVISEDAGADIEPTEDMTVPDASVPRAPSVSQEDQESGDEYEPPEVSTAPIVTVVTASETPLTEEPPKKKPRLAAGFIIDNSSDEEDAATPASSAGFLQPGIIKRSVSPSSLQNVARSASPNQVETAASTTMAQSGAAVPRAVPKARLPYDRIGFLEDRIKEDPRGDVDAWLTLIDEHRSRNKLDEVRATYERFFKIFPHAAEVLVAYVNLENDNDNFTAVEAIFGAHLMTVLDVSFWSTYLDYIRRINDVNNDPQGNARRTVQQAYEFVLDNIGIDPASGSIWSDYISFIHGGAGQVGGSGWQDKQKMDQLRAAYHRAVAVPTSNLTGLWRDYDAFEMNVNKLNGRKLLQERSPGYMTARAATTARQNLARDVKATTIPQLPPADGFDGDVEYQQQVRAWKRLISWEQEDPLDLRDDCEIDKYQKRVVYTFKQALKPMRFCADLWIDAADWCFANSLDTEGEAFLKDGIAANPESCLLAFKQADRLESTLKAEKTPQEKGALIRAPYEHLLDTYYDLIKTLQARENKEKTAIEEADAADDPADAPDRENEEEEDTQESKARAEAKAVKLGALRQRYEEQIYLLRRTLSFVWIALMRAMRRVQGKGNGKEEVGGFRYVFSEARRRGKLTSDVYSASALMEWNVYKDPAGTKIFERGIKLYPEDQGFMLEYLKHLISMGDVTNARVAFETAVSRLTASPTSIHKAKPLYAYFHNYEAQYGELAQISKLEQRMAELWPNDPRLDTFATRYRVKSFDPTATRPIISPATQMRPKTLVQSIETHDTMPQANSPRPSYNHPAVPSPKRALPFHDEHDDSNRPRKLARGESPLKGAAGRRLDQQQKRGHQPAALARDITFMLQVLPRARHYTRDLQQHRPAAMTQLLAGMFVSDDPAWREQKRVNFEINVRSSGMAFSFVF